MPIVLMRRALTCCGFALVFWLCAAAPSRALCLGICTCDVSVLNTAFDYNPLSASPKNVSSGEVAVHCTANVTFLFGYSVKLSKGGGPNYANRKLTSGAQQLSYQAYRDSGRTTVWGDGTASTGFIANSYLLLVSLGSRTDRFPVYVTVPAGQNAPQGVYTDTLTVTLEY